ncbi:MAG: hypothetical protein JNG88_16255 [Phycisphaerales bacterium]|nr:hypothetical protein [Phycisphaerales bacterium]
MRAYSMDLRKRVLAECDAGVSTKQVSQKYSVSASWMRRLKQRRRESGEIAPRQASRPRRAFGHTHAELIRSAVRARPDATLAELRDALGLSVSLPTLCRALLALRLGSKTSPPGGRTRSAGRRGAARDVAGRDAGD